jgi:glycine hydroxymethyltransferase
MDLSNKDITGREAEVALDHAGLNANRNTIPFDTKSPLVTSGVRLGTPAVTTRGMKETEMEQIASFIDEVIKNKSDLEKLSKIKAKVKEFAGRFAIYGGPLAR